MKTFVIAEIGVNHNGKRELALQLIEAAAKAGAHAAKFQTFKADTIAALNTPTVAYQAERTQATDQHAMLKALELSREDYDALVHRCRDLDIEFMSTAFDTASLDMLCDLGIKRIKIPSGEITNVPYLKDCARRGLPLILSTGMADMEEVAHAVSVVREAFSGSSVSDESGLRALTVLHCTSAYPTPVSDVNLAAMTTMARELGVEIGYSDHTEGTQVAPIAVALGARVIEKHITLDRGMPGPDHSASIEPDEFKSMMDAIRAMEVLVGDGRKITRESEREARGLVRRGLKVTRDLSAGSVLTVDDLAILRPATGLAPRFYEAIIGKRLNIDLKANAPLDTDAVDLDGAN